MGWQDRDWAKWTDEERDRYLGRGRPRRVSQERPLLTLLTVALAGLIVVGTFGPAALADRVDRMLRGSSAVGSPPMPPVLQIPGNLIVAGGPWPRSEVHFFNAAPEHAWALEQAVNAWNGSGAAVRFVSAPREQAELVITSESGQPCGHGRATLGYTPTARMQVFIPHAGQGCDPYSAARMFAHELGHILGLRHTSVGCAAMNPAGNYRGSSLCSPVAPWEWRCRLLEPADVAAAVGLYGGHAVPAGAESCPLYDEPPAPSSPRLVSGHSDGQRLELAFTRPADAAIPAFLAIRGEPAFTYGFAQGACLEQPQSGRYRWSVAPGGEQMLTVPIQGTGFHCLRVWASDLLGRPSAPATLEINVR